MIEPGVIVTPLLSKNEARIAPLIAKLMFCGKSPDDDRDFEDVELRLTTRPTFPKLSSTWAAGVAGLNGWREI